LIQAPDTHASSRLDIPLVRSRVEFILGLAREAVSIAHIGCTDAPYTRHRLDHGELLHAQLLALNPRTVGIDVDMDGIGVLQEAFPDAVTEQADVTAAERLPDHLRGAFDLVIAGEVLEHVPDPGSFLVGARQLLTQNGSLCVTVPNACSPKIGLRALLGREAVHPDHFTYYGPRTLMRTLNQAGFEVAFLGSYVAQPGRAGRVLNIALRAAHRLFHGPVGEGLVAIALPLRDFGAGTRLDPGSRSAPARITEHGLPVLVAPPDLGAGA
jgi:2-polyprenyl-3-methyl-5-hydroxy-6-metoxy-1,4-benzoquinol methylase